MIDGDGEFDVDVLFDVAVSPNGYAVAVGSREMGTSDLWIRKFEI